MKCHYASPLLKLFPRDTLAVTLFGHVFFRDADPPQWLRNHERIHCDQMKRDGTLKFYLTYVLSYYKNLRAGQDSLTAYKNIPYEAEAYANQHDEEYTV